MLRFCVHCELYFVHCTQTGSRSVTQINYVRIMSIIFLIFIFLSLCTVVMYSFELFISPTLIFECINLFLSMYGKFTYLINNCDVSYFHTFILAYFYTFILILSFCWSFNDSQYAFKLSHIKKPKGINYNLIQIFFIFNISLNFVTFLLFDPRCLNAF